MINSSQKRVNYLELKLTIQDLIAHATTRGPEYTLSRDAGIYLLYVDNFSDDRVIPFYIGQTTDFRRRYQDHIKDIKSLMQYSYAEYHNLFFWGATGQKKPFDGKLRPCKIFKYIIDHHCSLDDVKMIVIEKCDRQELDKKERYYLDLYLPAFFGFNQIATITEQFFYRNDPEKKRAILEQDYQYFQLYMEYGYSSFNYLHAFAVGHDAELDKLANSMLSNHLWSTPDKLLSDAVSAFQTYQRIYKQTSAAMKEHLGEQIHLIFEQCGLKSNGREEDVLSVLSNHYATSVVDDVNEKIDYLNYYFGRDKKSRECGRLLRILFDEHRDDIVQLSALAMDSFKTYVESRVHAIQNSQYSLLLPTTPY